jgi:N6-adenosine-specific RNA methylase IME4
MVADVEQMALFDYASLDSDTRTFVQEKAQAIHARLKRTAEDVIAIGQDLIEVKDRLGHGLFMRWVELEFAMSQWIANKFIQVAKRKDKFVNLTNISVSVLYELAAPSIPDAVIEMVESGQVPATIPAIREAKREWQEEKQEIPLIPRELQQGVEPVEGPVYGTVYQSPAPVYPLEKSPHDTTTHHWEPATPLPDLDREEERESKREQARERIANLKATGVDLPTGQYGCLVVDPPWTMQKIERDVRPNQVEFDYPTMTEEELKAFPLPGFAGGDCHLYLWTTQKHLPLALRLAEHWGFRYQCIMTWVKNVGFTPFSWMYSTEHVLFCTKGSLPLLALGKRLDFTGKVREHSRKPDEFYSIVREVSPGPRLDVFSRERREGFDQYGNEVGRFV